jgi:hypothetical protein
MVDGGWEEARCYHFTTAWRLPLMHARHKDTKIPRSSAVRSRHHTRRGWAGEHGAFRWISTGTRVFSLPSSKRRHLPARLAAVPAHFFSFSTTSRKRWLIPSCSCIQCCWTIRSSFFFPEACRLFRISDCCILFRERLVARAVSSEPELSTCAILW